MKPNAICKVGGSLGSERLRWCRLAWGVCVNYLEEKARPRLSLAMWLFQGQSGWPLPTGPETDLGPPPQRPVNH